MFRPRWVVRLRLPPRVAALSPGAAVSASGNPGLWSYPVTERRPTSKVAPPTADRPRTWIRSLRDAPRPKSATTRAPPATPGLWSNPVTEDAPRPKSRRRTRTDPAPRDFGQNRSLRDAPRPKSRHRTRTDPAPRDFGQIRSLRDAPRPKSRHRAVRSPRSRASRRSRGGAGTVKPRRPVVVVADKMLSHTADSVASTVASNKSSRRPLGQAARSDVPPRGARRPVARQQKISPLPWCATEPHLASPGQPWPRRESPWLNPVARR